MENRFVLTKIEIAKNFSINVRGDVVHIMYYRYAVKDTYTNQIVSKSISLSSNARQIAVDSNCYELKEWCKYLNESHEIYLKDIIEYCYGTAANG